MPSEPRLPDANRAGPSVNLPPAPTPLAGAAARSDPAAADGATTSSAQRDGEPLTHRDGVVGMAHVAQWAQVGGPVARTVANAVGVADAAQIALDVSRGDKVRALDVASAAASVVMSAGLGGSAVQLGAQAVSGVSAMDAADRALNSLRAKLREPDPADVEQRRAIERRNDDMLAMPRNGLDQQAARQAVKLDVASLHQIDDPRERHAASVAMGQNAANHSGYKAALARQDPAVAEAVALSYAKEGRAIIAKEDRKAGEFGAPGAARAPVNAIEYVFPRDRHAEAVAAPRHLVPPLEDRFNVVSRLRGRDYQFRDQPGKVAFRERWLSMTSAVDSPMVVKAMLDRADERGWREVRVRGSEEFQRQAWMAATARGIKAVGYEPTDGDRVAASDERARLERERRSLAVQTKGAIPPESQRVPMPFNSREGNAAPSASRGRVIEPSPATDQPSDAAAKRARSSPSQPTTASPDAARSQRASGRDAAILAALEIALEKTNVPEGLRNGLRHEVRKELDTLRVSGQAVKVAVHDPAASRQVPRSVQVPEHHRKVHERAR